MKKLAILAILTLAINTTTQAIDFTKTDTYTPAAAISNELWLLANTVKITQPTAKDVFVCSQTAEFNSANKGDIWACANDIAFLGQAQRNIRLCGRVITTAGQIGGNFMAFANTVSIDKGAILQGDNIIAGENVIFAGTSSGKLTIIGASVTLGGNINNGAYILAEDIVILPGTKIRGDIVYSSKKELFVDNKIDFQGKLQRINLLPEGTKASVNYLERAIFQFYFYLAALLTGLFGYWFVPRAIVHAGQRLRQRPWACAIGGFVAILVIPLLILFFLLSVIGIPLALILLTGYAILLYCGKIITAVSLGSRFISQTTTTSFLGYFGSLAIGLAILYALSILPVLVLPLWIAFTVFGLGAFIISLLNYRNRP